MPQNKVDWHGKKPTKNSGKNGTASELLLEWDTQIQHHPKLPPPPGDFFFISNNGDRLRKTQKASAKQTLLGWDLFLCSLITNDWKEIQATYDCDFPPKTKHSIDTWQRKFGLKCWKDRNSFVHGAKEEI